MKSKFKWLVLLALVLAVATLFAACGRGSNGGGSKPERKIDPDAQCFKDEKTLKDAGYSVFLYTDEETLSAYESKGGFEAGALEAYLLALKIGDTQTVVYYFTSASAAAAYHQASPGSVLKDNAVIFNAAPLTSE